MNTDTDAVSDNATGEQAYEPPRVVVLGTLAEMTLGRVAQRSDGINPGSLF